MLDRGTQIEEVSVHGQAAPDHLQPSREETGKTQGFAIPWPWLEGCSAEEWRIGPSLPPVTRAAYCGLGPTARGWEDALLVSGIPSGFYIHV